MGAMDEYLPQRYVRIGKYEIQQKGTSTMHQVELDKSIVKKGDAAAA